MSVKSTSTPEADNTPSVRPTGEVEAFLAYMEARVAAGSDIASRVLEADSLEGIFQAAVGEATKARDIIGVPILVTAVDWLGSDYSNEGESAYDCFVVVTATTTDGESVKVTCGAATVMQQLYKLVVGGHLPAAVSFDKTAKATKAGFFPLFLRDARLEFAGGF